MAGSKTMDIRQQLTQLKLHWIHTFPETYFSNTVEDFFHTLVTFSYNTQSTLIQETWQARFQQTERSNDSTKGKFAFSMQLFTGRAIQTGHSISGTKSLCN